MVGTEMEKLNVTLSPKRLACPLAPRRLICPICPTHTPPGAHSRTCTCVSLTPAISAMPFLAPVNTLGSEINNVALSTVSSIWPCTVPTDTIVVVEVIEVVVEV